MRFDDAGSVPKRGLDCGFKTLGGCGFKTLGVCGFKTPVRRFEDVGFAGKMSACECGFKTLEVYAV
jgi:hypothetical protein